MLFVDVVRPVHMTEEFLKDPMLKIGAFQKTILFHYALVLGDLLLPVGPSHKSSCIRFVTKLAKDLPARLRL